MQQNMSFSKLYLYASNSPSLPSTIGLLVTLVEFWITSSITVGYITALSLFLAYNTFYKAVDMSGLYVLKCAEALKIPVFLGGVAVIGGVVARGLTNVGGSVASIGWIMGGAIGKVMALPEDLLCSIMFKRQCPHTAEFVEASRKSGEAEGAAGEKMPLFEEREREGDEMV